MWQRDRNECHAVEEVQNAREEKKNKRKYVRNVRPTSATYCPTLICLTHLLTWHWVSWGINGKYSPRVPGSWTESTTTWRSKILCYTGTLEPIKRVVEDLCFVS